MLLIIYPLTRALGSLREITSWKQSSGILEYCGAIWVEGESWWVAVIVIAERWVILWFPLCGNCLEDRRMKRLENWVRCWSILGLGNVVVGWVWASLLSWGLFDQPVITYSLLPFICFLFCSTDSTEFDEAFCVLCPSYPFIDGPTFPCSVVLCQLSPSDSVILTSNPNISIPTTSPLTHNSRPTV